jgi:heme-degrading monooxygenase HmoA
MIVVTMRIRMKPEADLQDYSARIAQLLPEAQKVPGFVSLRGYSSQDGELLGLAEFETEEALEQWRQHAGHRIAKQLGRTRFYADLSIQICRTIDEYSYTYPTTAESAGSAAAASGASETATQAG